MDSVSSPLYTDAPAHKVYSLSVETIIRRYKAHFGIDVSRFFGTLSEISVYECSRSGFRFYYPFGIDGDSEFYEALEKNDFYYMDWKWEHEAALQFIGENDQLLEVGSGKGAFLKGLMERKKTECLGLELNADSIRFAREKALPIIGESIESFAEKNPENYDLVCYFQVLEHITNVYSFIEASLRALKKGGRLIICVPNNDSFIAKDNYRNILNMPPHHVGLWNEKSLKSLTELFPLSTEQILFEPLQPQHFNWYKAIHIREKYGDLLSKFYQVFLKMGFEKAVHKRLAAAAPAIKGHSIMAVFKKLG